MARNLFADETEGRNLFANEMPERESSITDVLTGADRQTQAIQGLNEVTGAPEFGGVSEFGDKPFMEALSNLYDKGLSGPAFKSAAGFLTTSDPKEKMQIIKSNYPEATFTPDEKGNVIVGLPSGDYVLNAPGLSTSDITNFAAQAAAFTPAGRAASIPIAIAKNAATQAAIEGVGEATGGTFNKDEVALSGALGGAGKLAENALGAGYRLATGKVSDDAAQAIADIESQGLKARTQDVIPAETLPGKIAASMGELNPITSGQQAAQQRGRQEAAESFVDRFKPSYEEIKKSVEGTLGAKFTKAIDDRQYAIDASKNAPLNVDNTLDAIDNEINRLTKSKSGAPLATADNASVDVLKRYRQDVINAKSIEDLADLRTDFRDDFSAALGEVKSSRKEGAKKRVYSSMTKDMDETIKPNVTPEEFTKYKKGNVLYGKTAEEVKKGRIKKILQGGEDLSPEQIDRVLLSKDSVVRNKMYNSLDEKGRENARAAIIRNLAESATKGGDLSVNQFLTKMNNNEKALSTFFRGSDKKELEGLRRALEATRSAQDAALNPPTGQRLAPYLVGGGAMADLGLTIAGTLGSAGAYKAYQSKPVRNALLKLANTPKGTSRFERALNDFYSALLPLLQSASSTE